MLASNTKFLFEEGGKYKVDWLGLEEDILI